MRWISALLLAASTLTAPSQAQEPRANGQWNVIQGLDSADLAVLGWTLTGTTAMPAGPETGLLVTFWRAGDGAMVRCIFSLVSRTGAQPFETCSLAQTVTAQSGNGDAGNGDEE